MTERERRALLKRRPDVVSWAALLEAARRAAMRPRQPAAETPAAESPAAESPAAAPPRPASGESASPPGGPPARRGNDRRVG
jgi:hypothetical protein